MVSKLSTGWEKLDKLLFGVGTNLVITSKDQNSEQGKFDDLEEITLNSNGEFCSNGKKIKTIIVGLQTIATPFNHIRDELVLKKIKDYRDSLYQEANAYTLGSQTFFNNTKPVGEFFAKEGNYMCIAVLYCRI